MRSSRPNVESYEISSRITHNRELKITHESLGVAATQAGYDWKKTSSKTARIGLETGLHLVCKAVVGYLGSNRLESARLGVDPNSI